MGRKVGTDLRAVREFLLRRAGDVPPYLGHFGVMHPLRKNVAFLLANRLHPIILLALYL